MQPVEMLLIHDSGCEVGKKSDAFTSSSLLHNSKKKDTGEEGRVVWAWSLEQRGALVK